MKLDSYQHAASETIEKRVLVASAPGSGKTRTIIARFEYMVDVLHIHPSQIAMLTFTRYASHEMRSRLGPKVGSAFLGTFHSFALQIIQRYGDIRKWDATFLTILDEAETEMDEREVLQDLGVIGRHGDWKRIGAGDWDRFKRTLTVGRPCGEKEDAKLATCLQVWDAVCDRLRSQNVLTFSLIMSEAMALLEDPNVRKEMRERYRHFVVDECQDTDTQQWAMIDAFKPDSVFIVGDVDQSVYEWRGARPDLFLKFAEGATIYHLPYSYRFGVNIGEPANRLIKYNQKRLDAAIQAIAENVGTVDVRQGQSYEAVAAIVAGEIKAGRKPEDIAVLSRRHATLDWATRALKNAGVPATKIGGETAVTNTAAFRAVRGYLRLAVNPLDRRAFMAIAAPEHIMTEAMWQLRAKAVTDCDGSLPKAYEKELPKDLEAVGEYLGAQHPEWDYGPALGYMRDVVRDEGISDTGELVRTLAMESVQDQLRTVKKSVALMTCHGAKGLEWKCVVVVGLNMAQFPSPRSIREGRSEEERRLMFVSITRAEETLYLVSGEPESSKDGNSVFLSEMGAI